MKTKPKKPLRPSQIIYPPPIVPERCAVCRTPVPHNVHEWVATLGAAIKMGQAEGILVDLRPLRRVLHRMARVPRS